MVELAIRLLAAGGMVLVAGILGWETFDTVWQTALCVCGYGAGVYILRLRGEYNPGLAGIAACLDAAAIAAILVTQGALTNFGFLVLAPIAYAAAKYGSLPSAMAPIAAFTLLGADQWSNGGVYSTPEAMGHALGVLVVGILLNHRRIVVSVAKPVLPEAVEPLQSEEPEAYLELRESFRKLKDMYHELERRSRRDRHAADLRLAASEGEGRLPRRLANQLKKLSGAAGISIYTLADHGKSIVVRAAEGSMPDSLRQFALHVRVGEAGARVRDAADQALRALSDPEESPLFRNVVLTHRGRVVGMVCVYHDEPGRLNAAAEIVEDLAPLAAEIVQDSVRRTASEDRMRRAELLYEISSVEAGATTENTLASRVIQELSSICDLEHLSIVWLNGSEGLPAATHGPHLRPLEAMSFASGPGLEGWLSVGSPEIVAFDISEDVRCRRSEMSKMRIQSLVVVPVGLDEAPIGYLSAASPRSGAIDVQTVESVRLVAAEFSQALVRLRSAAVSAPAGITLPGEFYERATSSESGCFVYLEPLRKEDLLNKYGRPAMELALRQFVHRLRTKLPHGAAVCRRSEGDFVVFLPDSNENLARGWANEAAAMASMIGLPVDENGKRVPLAIRAKVAAVTVPDSEKVGAIPA